MKSNGATKFEERHTRATFFIENDLLQSLKHLAGEKKGRKTEIINDALRDYFQRYGVKSDSLEFPNRSVSAHDPNGNRSKNPE
jgi:hypothetical protein